MKYYFIKSNLNVLFKLTKVMVKLLNVCTFIVVNTLMDVGIYN